MNTFSKSYDDYKTAKRIQAFKKLNKFVKDNGITREQLNVFLVRFGDIASKTMIIRNSQGDKVIKDVTIEDKITRIVKRFYDDTVTS